MLKVLAVIPARAGSKGIPNKNIRIINGKPLIAYCIENAINSKYITNIVVTTDSEEVKLIARYYGVAFRNRSLHLCADDVTLDAVVYDACKDYDGDLVITLQPTSPTLSVETLDRAIEYMIEKEQDTLISVVNKPHLAWVDKGGVIVPDYEERLNRQYLPKRFLETGAFLISRCHVIKADSRIGDKVSVYEISEEEAVDIDNFQDLLYATQILRKGKIAIIVNGNNQIGMGHIVRMLELADQFDERVDFYYDSKKTDKLVFGNTTYQVAPFSNLDELIDLLRDRNYKILINDILDTTKDYMKILRSVVPYIVNFEDVGEGSNFADIVINALYGENNVRGKVYCGADYYIIPKLFLMYKPITIRREINNILVCFGGADPQNYTERILNIIEKDDYLDFRFTVVLGRMKNNYENIMYKYQQNNIKIKYDVKNMPEVMHKADIAITSQGRTCYELASLGIPTLAIAQNDREEKHTFVCRENGFINLSLGCTDVEIENELKQVVFGSQELRNNMHKKMLSCNLKHGGERVKNLIYSLY